MNPLQDCLSFDKGEPPTPRGAWREDPEACFKELKDFVEFGRPSETGSIPIPNGEVPVFVNEFWTSRQRVGHSLHEISYRACYKPQLPEFFIRRICQPGHVVYDPFMGRGTTLLEARLLGCHSWGNDINPLSPVLTAPRLNPPDTGEIRQRLRDADLTWTGEIDSNLLVFFEEKTLREIEGWRAWFRGRKGDGSFDRVDGWLQMVAANRLTGHSPGFFSVYTLPPNQATSVTAQRKINEKRNQIPSYRDTRAILWKKSLSLLGDPLPRDFSGRDVRISNSSAENTPLFPDNSVDLVVTSPPFVDTVDYRTDNWLRMWFCEVDNPGSNLWQIKSVQDWSEKMTLVFRELRRVLKPGGWIAFEVGEVRKGTVKLEDYVLQAALGAGLQPVCLFINSQVFTKTANCWGVNNNALGTNSNRIVLLKKT